MFFDYLADLIIGIVFSIFFITAGFVLALNFKSLYYNDIELLNIEKTSSLDNEVIKNNYDCLVRYMQPNTKGDLILPNFTLSESASEHFFEVKNLFKIVYLLAAFSGIVCLVIIIMKIRNDDHQFLFISSIIASILPLSVLISILTKFGEVFDKTRTYLFANTNWDLSAETDPIATILPDKFFQHSALAIFSFALICGLCLFVLWKGLKQRSM
jgi:integral membrane protein (TIGR01906 family)